MSDVELAVIFSIIGVLVSAALLLRMMTNAPFGSEDSAGFHYEQKRRE